MYFHNIGWESNIKIVYERINLKVKANKTFEVRRVWRYQRGNQKSYIEEQKTQWPNEKVQKDKQRSTKHTYKTKDRVTRTPPKTGCELGCSGRVSSSCRKFKLLQWWPTNRTTTSHLNPWTHKRPPRVTQAR